MRDPETFKYDVRVRDRMLRARRITIEEVNGILDSLPDVERDCELVALNQPAIDSSTASNAPNRPSFAPPPISEITDDAVSGDEADDADEADE